MSKLYKDLFDQTRQNRMRSFFLEVLSPLGTIKSYKKNEYITVKNMSFVGIVTKGKVKQSLYSSSGVEKALFILLPGEIFGEMIYFTGGNNYVYTKSIEKSEISIVPKEKLENVLEENPQCYRYFIHSITRKYRISMFQMADLIFNSALGRIADALIRLSSQQGKMIEDGLMIDLPLTHQELGALIGCSRATVTKGLNEFRDKGIIKISQKKIIIKDLTKLKTYINI